MCERWTKSYSLYRSLMHLLITDTGGKKKRCASSFCAVPFKQKCSTSIISSVTNRQQKHRRHNEERIGRVITFGVVLKVLDKHMLNRRRLERQDQTMTHNLCRQRQTLLRQCLNPFQFIALSAGLDILKRDIDHKEASLEMGDGFATWGNLLARTKTTDPKVEDRCEGEHGQTGVGLATLQEGLLAGTQE